MTGGTQKKDDSQNALGAYLKNQSLSSFLRVPSFLDTSLRHFFSVISHCLPYRDAFQLESRNHQRPQRKCTLVKYHMEAPWLIFHNCWTTLLCVHNCFLSWKWTPTWPKCFYSYDAKEGIICCSLLRIPDPFLYRILSFFVLIWSTKPTKILARFSWLSAIIGHVREINKAIMISKFEFSRLYCD